MGKWPEGPTGPTARRADGAELRGRVRLKQLRYRAFELGQLLVHLDHLVRRDRVGRVDVGQVLSPLTTAFAPVEQETVGAGAVGVDGGVFHAPTANALSLVWFQL